MKNLQYYDQGKVHNFLVPLALTLKIEINKQAVFNIPPVDLYLISEKSIWKNQVQGSGI